VADGQTEKPALLKAGERVEYPEVMKFQLGGERMNEQGTVVDVVNGEASALQIVFSKPDSYMALQDDAVPVRIDYVIVGERQVPVRRAP